MVAWQSLFCALALGASGETVLIDFSASWCGPCKQMDPVVSQLIAAGYPVRKVDIDQQPELARRFKVEGVPCFVMLVDGREVGRQVGATTRGQLEQMLKSATSATVAPTTATERPRLIPKQITEPFNRLAEGVRNVVTGPAQPDSVDPQVVERVMAASVRLTIRDGEGKSTGSGTIIDCRSGEALIVTCAHVFRESQGRGQVDVDLFGPNGRRTVTGTVVSFDLKADVGLVRIRTGNTVVATPLASTGYTPRKGETVINVGCSHGEDPSSRVSQIASLDKFLGPANIQVAGQPVQGRSGGGLFTAKGELIGVCNAADPSDDEGLYAALKVVRGEIARMGLESILSRPGELAAAPPAMPSRMPGFDTRAEQPLVRANAQSPDPQPNPVAGSTQVTLSPAEAAMLHEVRQKAAGAEVVCIVRPGDPRAKSEVVVLDRASPELLAQLTNDRQRQDSRLTTSLETPTPTTVQTQPAVQTPATAQRSVESRPSPIPQIRTSGTASAASQSWLPKWGAMR